MHSIVLNKNALFYVKFMDKVEYTRFKFGQWSFFCRKLDVKVNGVNYVYSKSSFSSLNDLNFLLNTITYFEQDISFSCLHHTVSCAVNYKP